MRLKPVSQTQGALLRSSRGINLTGRQSKCSWCRGAQLISMSGLSRVIRLIKLVTIQNSVWGPSLVELDTPIEDYSTTRKRQMTAVCCGDWSKEPLRLAFAFLIDMYVYIKAEKSTKEFEVP